jgi:chaperone modulatory protein CbpM
MIAPPQDAVRFDTVTEVTWTQLVNASGLSEAELTELVQYGALVPRDPSAAPLTFESRWLMVARTASRLRRDFDLDVHGVSVVLSFVERIESLEAELRRLRAQLG